MSQLEQGSPARRWSRHKIDVRLKVCFPNDGKNDSAFGRANSLSRGGIGAYIPCTIPVGTTVRLELTFPYSSTEILPPKRSLMRSSAPVKAFVTDWSLLGYPMPCRR